MPQSSSHPRHFIVMGVIVAISTGVLYWLLSVALPLPPQASAEAVIIDRLIGQHLFMIALLFAIVMVPMIYSFVVFRQKEGENKDGEHFEGNTKLEIFWTTAPAIFVVIFIYIGYTTFHAVVDPKENELEIDVTGQQWSWVIEYEGGVMDTDLVLPVNQPTVLKLHAKDVLHSFWVPAFRVKQDLVPGQTTEVRFTPTEVGTYRLRCAELCGLSHYTMLTDVRVVEADEFAMWMSEELAKVNPNAELAKQVETEAASE